MKTNIEYIVAYAERFAELAKKAETEEDFSHNQSVREVELLAHLINKGEFKQAVRLFELLIQEGTFIEGNGNVLLPKLVSDENMKGFVQAHNQFKDGIWSFEEEWPNDYDRFTE